MTSYYSFGNKYPSRYEPMDPKNAVPGVSLQPSLATGMNDELKIASEQGPAIQNSRVPCCTGPKPCRTWISWKPQYAGCGDTYVSWDAATNGIHKGCEVAPRDARLWVADLRPEIYERSLISGAKWRPEPYSHPHARQLFVQFLNSTKYPDSSPNEKRIDSLSDTFCTISRRYGQPQYTSF